MSQARTHRWALLKSTHPGITNCLLVCSEVDCSEEKKLANYTNEQRKETFIFGLVMPMYQSTTTYFFVDQNIQRLFWIICAIYPLKIRRKINCFFLTAKKNLEMNYGFIISDTKFCETSPLARIGFCVFLYFCMINKYKKKKKVIFLLIFERAKIKTNLPSMTIAMSLICSLLSSSWSWPVKGTKQNQRNDTSLHLLC